MVYADPDSMIAWAQDRTPGRTPYRADARAIGLIDDELRAVVVFDNFTPWDCHVHISTEGRHAMTEEFVRHCCAFPFITCGFDRVSATISTRHRAALSIARWVGFRREGLARGAGHDRLGMVLLGMTRQECRWLPRTLLPQKNAPAR